MPTSRFIAAVLQPLDVQRSLSHGKLVSPGSDLLETAVLIF
jgi:hypothetical protein